MLERLREEIAKLGADALLVTQPANVRYLSGFSSPEDGRVLVTEDKALLLTDGRYTAQATEESRLELLIVPSSSTWQSVIGDKLKGRKLAVEAEHLTLATFQSLSEKLGKEPITSKGLLSKFRLIKTPQEIDTLRQAAHLTDKAFEHILNVMGAGMQEVEVALELEAFMRKGGAEDKSFAIIVASGYRSAMPHGIASNKVIEAGDLVTLDFGAKVDGYHADMTRAVAVGEVSEELRRMYDAVLDAQQTALDALVPGKDGKDIDGLAREVLSGYGLKDYFVHSLGHGVGLEVHEDPRLSQQVSQTLQAGMAVTVEPGVYVPGRGGVRIEDLAVMTEGGFERLSLSDKTFVQV